MHSNAVDIFIINRRSRNSSATYHHEDGETGGCRMGETHFAAG
jgi:hypothetical protein